MATGTVFTNDVIITNLTAKNCSIDKLKDYFSNKKKSGISSFKDIKIVNQSTAILCLEDEEAVITVLGRNHNNLGKGVELTRHAIIAPLPKKKGSNKSFSIPVLQHHVACLQISQKDLESQLKDYHAALYVDKERSEIQIIPCPGNEYKEDWRSGCQHTVDTFIKSLYVATVNIPLDKKDLMNPVIDETIQNKHLLHIEYMEDTSIAFITGEKSEAIRVKKELETICESLTRKTFNVPHDKEDLMHPVINETIQDEKCLHIEYIEDKSVVLITGEKSEVARVNKKLEDICGSITNETFNIPLDKKELMHPFIDETIQKEQLVRIKHIEDKSIVLITGEKSEAIRVKQQLENICRTIVINERFPVSSDKFYTLLNAVLKGLRDKHPKVEATLDSDDYSIRLTGFVNDCEQFKSDLSELNSSLQCIPVLLTSQYEQFVVTQPDKALLNYYFGKFISENVTYYIDHDQMGSARLFILGTSNNQVAMEALVNEIKDNLCCIFVPYPAAFRKSLVGSKWVNFSSRLKERHLVQISYAKNKIQVMGDSRMSNLAKMEIEDFIKNHGVALREFQLHYGQWRLIKLHLNEKWSKLVCKLQKDRGVRLIVPTVYDERPSIILEADEHIFKAVEEEIEDFLSVIVSSTKPITEERRSIIEYFCSETGRCAVEQIKTDKQSYIHTTIEDGNGNVSTIVSRDGLDIQQDASQNYSVYFDVVPQLNLVCTGYTGSVRVNLYHGDITMLPVDVMVNATDIQMKHTRGVAMAIAKAGGPCIQSASDAYLQSVDNMKEGDVIMMQEVGNLPCKNLIHVVAPTWQDGTHKESFILRQACITALQMASPFQSISFPAIGCGSYEFPIIVCAKNMVKAVITCSQENPSFSTIEVSFVLLDQREVDDFARIMNKLLGNVTFSSAIPEALGSASFSSSTTSKYSYGDFITEDKEDYVVVTKQDQSVHDHDNDFQVSTINAISNSISSRDNQEQYIELLNGELLQHTADVYVNTVGTDLVLSNGAVSYSFLNAGGQALQDECKLYVSQHGVVPVGSVVVTKPGNIPCQRIIHTVGTNYDGKHSEGVMKDIIQKCLIKCDELKASVIAFPALGTGNLKYPIHVVADIMINTIADYIKANIDTTHIKTVKLVIYLKDHYQEFYKVLHSHTKFVSQTLSGNTKELYSQHSKVDNLSTSHDHSQSLGSNTVDSHYKIGTVMVEFVHGDITNDDSDVIVNPTNENMWLSSAGQISNAILRKGGSELQVICDSITSQGYCLKSGMVCPTNSTGSLLCKKIFHVNVHSDNLCEVVIACLQQAEQTQLASIAFPAIGTGALGYDIDIVAQLMCQPVIEFAQALPKYVNRIRFVIFEKGMVYCFKQVFSALQTIGISGMQPSASTPSPSLIHNSNTTKPKPAVLTAPLAKSIPKKPVLLMQVFADDAWKVQQSENCLLDLIEKQLHSRKVKDKNILKLPSESITEIKQEADLRNVAIDIEQGRLQHYIQLKGDFRDVEELMHKINSILMKINDDEAEQQKIRDTRTKVRWQWKNVTGTFEDYDDLVNYEVEQAYQLNPISSFVYNHTYGSTEMFDFQHMKAQHGNDTFTIKRMTKCDPSTDDDLPKEWDPMPPKTTCNLVTLDVKSNEFSVVKQCFENTMSQMHQILKIERVQNSVLYRQYMVRKKDMDQRNPKTVQNQRMLFHGCPGDVTEKISHLGFNRSFAGKNAAVFGWGVYFAESASYSARDIYSPPDSFNYKYMFLAKVLTGEFVKGDADFLQPPSRTSETDLYDSCVNDINNPTIFVIFHDSQAYPEYLITFVTCS